MKITKSIVTIKFFLLISLITLFISGCTSEDISSVDLKNSQWIGYNLTGWKLEGGIKKNVSQKLGKEYGSFDLSFNGSNYLWNISKLAGIPDKSETGTWVKVNKDISLTSSTGEKTNFTVKEFNQDLTNQLSLIWAGADFEYTINFSSR